MSKKYLCSNPSSAARGKAHKIDDFVGFPLYYKGLWGLGRKEIYWSGKTVFNVRKKNYRKNANGKG